MLAVAPVAPPPGPQALCAVSAPELAELSGMVVADGELVALPDGGRRVTLYRMGGALDGDCAVTGTRRADIDPADVEDLALGPDGSLWAADTGDNARSRDTVAVIVVPPAGEARLHRLTYPDGPHDAEALLVDPAGRPVIVTKEIGGAGVYRTAAPPDGVGPTPLERLGDVRLPPSDTPGGPVAAGFGSRLVTGAAVSADGRVVALRTYTDAWLYRAPDGDPATALTENGAPFRVPLPDEPQGESIAFGPDGTLYSGSEARRGVLGEIRAVPGAPALLPAIGAEPTTTPGPESGAAAPPPDDLPEAPPPWGPAATGGAIAVGLLLAAIGAMALRGRRNR